MVEWIKTYNTIEVWTLIVAVATFIVTCLSYRYARRSDKRRIKSEIARKQALLNTLSDRFTTMGVDHTVADSMRVQQRLLDAEIEELKLQL